VPFLDLVNEETISMEPEEYTGDHFHSIPRGAKNGIQVYFNTFCKVFS